MLKMAEVQVAVAWWLAMGMAVVLVSILCTCCGFRKTALLFMVIYGVSLIMLPVGWTVVLGPAIVGAAALGLIVEYLRGTRASRTERA